MAPDTIKRIFPEVSFLNAFLKLSSPQKHFFKTIYLGGKKMKTLFLLLVICITFNSNLFAQYYIGQDKIDILKSGQEKFFRVDDNFKSSDYEVYLESAGGHISDVIIGFDKSKYSRGESIILTFKRTGENSSVENEFIWVSGVSDITGNDCEIEKSSTGYFFNLKPSEVKKISINPKNRNQQIDRISLGIGKYGPTREGRTYVIPYPPILKDSLNNNGENSKIFKIDFDRENIHLKKKL